MARLTMTMGLPASGKTTWAKEQVEAAGGHIKRFNRDDLRLMMDLGKWSKENEAVVSTVQLFGVTAAIRAGFDAIVDDTNFDPVVRRRLVEAARLGVRYLPSGEDLSVYVKDFSGVPIEVCVARAAQRDDGNDWEQIIEGMAARWGVQGRG